MDFDFGKNSGIDLTQGFLPVYNLDLRYSIYRFNIYATHPDNVFGEQEIEYYSILDESNGDSGMLGIKYILNGKVLQLRTKLCITQGDVEVFTLICEELCERLSKKKMAQLKSKRKKPLAEEKDDSN